MSSLDQLKGDFAQLAKTSYAVKCLLQSRSLELAALARSVEQLQLEVRQLQGQSARPAGYHPNPGLALPLPNSNPGRPTF